jgi:membrane fusion protein (multidrug efflux system)
VRLKRELAAGQIRRVDGNQAPAKLLLEDGSAYESPGTLQFSEVTVDQGTGSVTLRAIFPNSQGFLLPGMFVRATIVEGTTPAALLVPEQGVGHDQKGQPTALVVGADGVVQQRQLQIAQTVGNKWLVTAGLAAGDRVVVEGTQSANPGDHVRVVPADNVQ